MYSGLPPANRRIVKTTLASAWLLAASAGLSAVVMSPTRIINELGSWGTLASGILLGVSAIFAALGVVGNRYRWEWIASWMSAVALAPYFVTVWALTFLDSWTRSNQAFLVSSLLAFFVSRAVICAAHAAKLRVVHVAQAVTTMEIMTGEGAADGRDGSTGDG